MADSILTQRLPLGDFRKCAKCSTTKSVDDFYQNSGGPSDRCKDCTGAIVFAYLMGKRDEVEAGLRRAAWDRSRVPLAGACAFCDKPFSWASRGQNHNSKRKYCGRKCQRTAQSLNPPRHCGRRGGKIKRSPTWETWWSMITRCRTPSHASYKNYGGRGISVCERWKVFENFLADMGERPPGTSLDRIDNNGNYVPGNCRWATVAEQNLNKRNTIFTNYAGERLTLKEWAARLNMSYHALYTSVVRRGVSMEDAVARRRK